MAEVIASSGEGTDPEHEALLADSVGLALLVVLDRLTPAERLAFVLHDMFAVPFDEIAPIVGRSPSAARQLASRARRRVQGAARFATAISPASEKWSVRSSRPCAGDFDALLAVLDSDVVVRAEHAAVRPGAPREVRGARVWAKQALAFARGARFARPALVNGAVGAVVAPGGRLFRVLRFTLTHGKIVQIDVVADPARLRQLDLAVLND